MQKLIVNEIELDFKCVSNTKFIVNGLIITHVKHEYYGYQWLINSRFDYRLLKSIVKAIQEQYPELISRL